MPHLARLVAAGFRIWPFQDAATPVAVEIWPRLFTGSVNKGSRDSRIKHLAHIGGIEEPLLGVAASNDDVFDAAVAALYLWRHSVRLIGLARRADCQVEGEIWRS